MRVHEATPADLPRIVELVQALAEYERAAGQASASVEDFADALFPDHGHPTAFAHVAEVGGEVVAMAVWYLTFSTWTGRSGIWLEDLFVLSQHRGSGCGRALLATLARICRERGYPRLEWWVLNWNEPSIGFYRSLGAQACEEWTTFRLEGAALERLGG